MQAASDKAMTIAEDYAQEQLSLVKQDNAPLALAQFEILENQTSARQFLDDSQAYLQRLLDEKDTPSGIAKGAMKKVILQTKKRIEAISAELQRADDDNDTTDPAQLAETISQLVAPGSDTDYIPGAITAIVKQDIEMKLKYGKLDPNLALVLKASAMDSLSTFLNTYGDLEKVRNQIRASEALTQADLTTVGKTFSGIMKGIFEKLQQDGKTDKKAQESLSLFCLQALLLPSAPALDSGLNLDNFCRGQKYSSLYQKNPTTLNYDTLEKESFDQRACSLYDFFRIAKLTGEGRASSTPGAEEPKSNAITAPAN